jgi:plastocyanin
VRRSGALRIALALVCTGLAGISARLAVASELEVHVPVVSAPGALPSVVYLIQAGASFKPRPGASAIIDQIKRQFAPQVSVVEVGTSVSFPNKDDIRHHVYSFSEAKPFELKLYSGRPSHPVVFDRAGVVTLGCNIHDVMLGYVLVVETPWHALTDSTGTARISDLPPGDYVVHAWTPGARQGEHPTEALHLASEGATAIRLDMRARAAAPP